MNSNEDKIRGYLSSIWMDEESHEQLKAIYYPELIQEMLEFSWKTAPMGYFTPAKQPKLDKYGAYREDAYYAPNYKYNHVKPGVFYDL
jgi:hypothetical protein